MDCVQILTSLTTRRGTLALLTTEGMSTPKSSSGRNRDQAIPSQLAESKHSQTVTGDSPSASGVPGPEPSSRPITPHSESHRPSPRRFGKQGVGAPLRALIGDDNGLLVRVRSITSPSRHSSPVHDSERYPILRTISSMKMNLSPSVSTAQPAARLRVARVLPTPLQLPADPSINAARAFSDVPVARTEPQPNEAHPERSVAAAVVV